MLKMEVVMKRKVKVEQEGHFSGNVAYENMVLEMLGREIEMCPRKEKRRLG